MEPSFQCYEVNSNKDVVVVDFKDKKTAISELKQTSKSLSKTCKNENREISSNKIIDVARGNFETARKLIENESAELGKSRNPLSKITLYLAKNWGIYLGELGNIHKIYKKFDKIVGLARKDIDDELKINGLYLEMASNKKESVEELKRLGQSLPLHNAAIVVFSPRNESKQYLSCISVTHGLGSVHMTESVVRYLGSNDEGKPIFLVRGDYSEKKITGIEELKNYIAFGSEEISEDKVVLTREEAAIWPLIKNQSTS